jgi:hypothetical protein
MRFSVRKCDNAKMLEWFPRPLHVKPLQEHFQEKWNAVFRPKMRQRKNAGAVSASAPCETAPGAFSGKVECGFPSEDATTQKCWSGFCVRSM